MLQKKYCSWSRLISACARNIFGHELLTAVMQQTLLVAGAQLCRYAVDQSSCALDCCVVGQNCLVLLMAWTPLCSYRCSWPKQLCFWLPIRNRVAWLGGQSTNAACSLVLSSSFGVLAAWCSWCHEQSRSFMGAASECCPGQLPNTLRSCTLAHYLLEAVVQKIQLNLVLICTILMLCKDNF